MATKKQIACIYALSKKLGKEVPNDIKDMSNEDASTLIDELKAEPQPATQPKQTSLKVEHDVNVQRLGMCVKLVFDRYKLNDIFTKKEISEQVITMYKLVDAIEKTIMFG